MSCGVGHRRGLDLALLWLWYRLAATALIRPLAWEPSHAMGAALKRQKKKKQKNNKNCLENLKAFVFIFSLLGAKRPRVTSGGVSESPSGFSKHIQSNLDFSPVNSASR